MININMIWLVSFTGNTSVIKKKTVTVRKNNLKTFQVTQKIREEFGGENALIEQCNNIPDVFVDGLTYCERYHEMTYAETLHK